MPGISCCGRKLRDAAAFHKAPPTKGGKSAVVHGPPKAFGTPSHEGRSFDRFVNIDAHRDTLRIGRNSVIEDHIGGLVEITLLITEEANISWWRQ